MMPRNTLLNRAPRALLITVIAAAASLAAGLLPAAAGAATRAAEIVPSRYIAVYRDAGAAAGAETAVREKRDGFAARFVYRRAVKGFAAKLAPGQLRKLRADPEIAFVVPDRRVHATATLTAGDTAPTGIRRIGAATATTAHKASGAGVAVIDTGIDLDHPDLAAAAGVNCAGTGAPDDDNGHGTHVAGTIAARNDGAGVVGVAPGTRVWAVKVLDASGSGTTSGIICGIDWVTATRTDTDPANDIAVANMSLGGAGNAVAPCATTTDPMHRAICASTAAGVTYVVAAGNDGWDFDYARVPDTPAAYPEVLTVTAVSDSNGRAGGTGAAAACEPFEIDDRYASFSNFAATAAGAAHTIAAPGTCITSTWPGGAYDTISGTSMATPHVTGAVALCLNEGGVAGPCADDGGPAGVIATMRADARNATLRSLVTGFYGDPLRPVVGRTYGYAVVGGRPGATPAPVTTLTSFKPSSAQVLSGSVTAGGLSSLGADDGARLEVAAAAGSPYIAQTEASFFIPSTHVGTLKRLAVDHEGYLTSGAASVSLRAFNVRTGAWITIDGPRTGVTVDRARTWVPGVAADYVSPSGQVRFRVRATRTGGSFRTRTDVVRLTIEN